MKKLSFLELEKEMAKQCRIITDQEDLKSIEGGRQSGMDTNMGFVTAVPFDFKDTTIVKEQGTDHSSEKRHDKGEFGLIDNSFDQKLFNGEMVQSFDAPPSKTIIPSTTLDEETLWALQHPKAATDFYQNAGTASSVASDMPGVHNGIGDAYRHAYWSALNSQDDGAGKAISFGLAHERSTPNNPYNEKQMDLNNNAWGATYASNHPNFTFNDFTSAINDAVANGSISIIEGDATEVHPDPPSSGSTGGYDGYID